MAIRILDPDRMIGWCRLYIDGERNSGKTTLSLGLCSILSGDPPFLVIDLESHDGANPTSIVIASQDRKKYKGRIYKVVSLVDSPTPESLNEALAYAEGLIANGTIGAVLIDGMSAIWTELEHKQAAKAKNKWAEYKDIRPRLTGVIDRMIALKTHLVVTCMTAEKTTQNRTTKEVVSLGTSPIFSPKERFPDRFLIACRLTVQSDTQGNERRVLSVLNSKLNFQYGDIDLRKGFSITNPGQKLAKALLHWANGGDVSAPPQETQAPASPPEDSMSVLGMDMVYDLVTEGGDNLYSNYDSFVGDISRRLETGEINANMSIYEIAKVLKGVFA